MTSPMDTRTRRLLRDRRGMALPVALLGLVGISILVVGVLISSSGEAASSSAHQAATRQMYAVEGGIEAFVASQGVGLVPGAYAFTAPNSSTPLQMTVTQMAIVPTPGLPNVPTRVFSIHGRPSAGGREMSAMVRLAPFQFNINSPTVFGGNAVIGGSTIVSDGSDSDSCDLEAADNAIVHASGADVEFRGNQTQVIGSQRESTLSGDELIREALGGMSIREFAQFLHSQNLPSTRYVTFGSNAIWGNSEAFSGNGNDKPSSLSQSGNNAFPRDHTHRYNWYCPGRQDSNNHCYTKVPAADTLLQKIILANGDVRLQGDHGQGLLIVLNGGIQITGNFVFRGLILAENDIDMGGTGNKVEGAIMSRNEVRVTRENDSDSEILGNAVIRFNRCAINQVMASVNPAGGGMIPQRTERWAEVMR
jgi:hypothetical protein